MANFFKKALPYLAGAAGSGIANQFSALKPFSAAIGAGAGAIANKNNRLAGAAQGLLGGGIGSTIMGGAKSALNGGGLTAFSPGAGQGFRDYMGSIPGFGGFGTSNPTGVLAKFTTSTPSQQNVLQNGTPRYAPIKNTAGEVTGYTPRGVNLNTSAAAGSPASSGMVQPMTTSFMPQAGTQKMNPMQFFGGAGIAALGSALSPTPDAPDYSNVMDQFRTQVQSGGNPEARQAAMNYYLNAVSNPTNVNPEDAVANARLINERQKAESLRAIDQQFRAAMPGANFTNSSEYQAAVAKNNAAYDQNYAAQAAQSNAQMQLYKEQQQAAAANALAGMDDAQLQYFAGLAGLSVQQIQDQFMLDAGKAQSLQDLAATAGQILMQKGVGAI